MSFPVSRSRQRGLSLWNTLFVGSLVFVVGVVGAQSVPIYLEYFNVQSAVERAQNHSTVAEIRAAFDRAALIEEIHSVKGADLDITKRGEKVVVSFAYAREIHLVGPAYLVFRFQGQSH